MSEKKKVQPPHRNLVNRRAFLGTVGAISPALIAGCSGGGNGTEGEGGSNGNNGEEMTLDVSVMDENSNIDSAFTRNNTDDWVAWMVYDRITYVDDEFNIIPNMIEDLGELAEGGEAYDVTIRDDMVFQNGDPITVEDFKYTADFRIGEIADIEADQTLPFVEGTEIVGDHTLRFKLSREFARLPEFLMTHQYTIVQEGSRPEIEEGVGGTGVPATRLSSEPTETVAGPFKFVNWESGSHIELEKNENYWVDGKPQLDRIRINFHKEDATRLSRLQSAQDDLTLEVPPKDFASLEDDPNIETISTRGRDLQVMYTNLAPVDDNPMADRHKRRAVQFAIDKTEIAENIFHGNATPMTGLWYPESDWTSSEVSDPTYDPDAARDELEEAGTPDGFEMDIMTTTGGWYEDMSVLIQNQLAEVGIETEITVMEDSAMFDQVYNSPDWHTAVQDNGYQAPTPFEFMYRHFRPNNRNHNHWHAPSEDLPDPHMATGPEAPEGDYENARAWYYDKLGEAMATPDDEEARQILYELQEFNREEAIQIELVMMDHMHAHQSYVEDYTSNAFHYDFRDTYIDE